MAFDWMGSIGNVGRLFGGAAQGAAHDRIQTAPTALSQEQVNRRSQILSSLLGGLDDASVTAGNPNIQARTPQITGGLRPSAMLSGGRREALISQLSQPVDVTSSSTGEKVLGGIGMGAGILDAMKGVLPFLGGGKGNDGADAPKGPSGTSFPGNYGNMFETPEFQEYANRPDRPPTPNVETDITGMQLIELEDGTFFNPLDGQIYDQWGNWVGSGTDRGQPAGGG